MREFYREVEKEKTFKSLTFQQSKSKLLKTHPGVLNLIKNTNMIPSDHNWPTLVSQFPPVNAQNDQNSDNLHQKHYEQDIRPSGYVGICWKAIPPLSDTSYAEKVKTFPMNFPPSTYMI